ncbi:MAG: hypothetical protein R3D83_01085 [Caenibius sp.]
MSIAGPFKRRLQRFGSFVVRKLSRTAVTDAVSGFRAISRERARRLIITTEFSYTTDMLIQAGRKRLAIASVPVRTNMTRRLAPVPFRPAVHHQHRHHHGAGLRCEAIRCARSWGRVC